MLNLEQRSKEWHEFRRNHIGASDAPVIMGVSPWKSELELYNEKVSCTEIPDNSNFAMRRGVELEPHALSLFEAQTGYLMMPRVLEHPKYKFLSASLDGLELDSKCAVEIKCAGHVDHNLALQGKIPEKYMPQLQHQMMVCGLESIYYMSYRDDNDFKILEVKRDNDYCNKLLEKELEFWDRIQRKDPPTPTDRDITEIKDPYWSFYVDKWRILQDEKRKLEERETEIREAFIQLADNHPAQGFGLKLTKVKRVGNLDYQKIVKDHVKDDVDLEVYRKPGTESWRITMKEENELE